MVMLKVGLEMWVWGRLYSLGRRGGSEFVLTQDGEDTMVGFGWCGFVGGVKNKIRVGLCLESTGLVWFWIRKINFGRHLT